MNAQPVRWPDQDPLILLGGCDIPEWKTRYLHLGSWRGLVCSVEHKQRAWTFRVSLGPVAVKVRLSGGRWSA